MKATPGQTVGPFFGYALPFDSDHLLISTTHPDAVLLHGHVYDGAGDPVPDALVELSQTAAGGDLVTNTRPLCGPVGPFTGWGRSATDAKGHYSFTTIQPGSAFVGITVFARGLLDRLCTRAYVPTAINEPFLATLDPVRRNTLIMKSEGRHYVFDIHMQGKLETVFLSYPER